MVILNKAEPGHEHGDLSQDQVNEMAQTMGGIDGYMGEYVEDRVRLGERIMIGMLGRPRQGKSLLAAFMCAQLAAKGYTIFHTGNLRFGFPISISWLSEQNPEVLSNCIIYLDEVKQILPSVGSATAFGQLVESNLIQAGHQGLSVIWTTISGDRLDSILYELTDYVYYVSGAKRKWTQQWQIDSGEVHPDDDNRCAGFDLNHVYWPYHAVPPEPLTSCLSVERQHGIRFEIVSQKASTPGYGKFRRKGTLHCAHRMYGAFDTHNKVDATSRMLITADQLRDQALQQEFELVRQVLKALVDDIGYERVDMATLGDIVREQGLDVPNNRLGRHLSAAGVAKKRNGGVTYYHLRAWRDRHAN